MKDDERKIIVYYDGACPRCVQDRRTYERLAAKAREQVSWFDITGREDQLRAIGIDPLNALTELHVRDENGRIMSELNAYILLLSRIPLLKPLAWLIGMPVVRPLLSRLYHGMVIRRLRKSGRL